MSPNTIPRGLGFQRMNLVVGDGRMDTNKYSVHSELHFFEKTVFSSLELSLFLCQNLFTVFVWAYF